MTDDELHTAVRRVVADYGPHGLGDPLALRTALRDCCPGLPPAYRDLLLAVCRAGVVDRLRSAGPATVAAQIDRAVGEVSALVSAPVEDARRACAALAQSVPATPVIPTGQTAPAGPANPTTHAIPDDPASAPDEPTVDHSGPAPRRPRYGLRAALVTAAALAALVAVAVGVATTGGTPADAPDLTAPDQVQQRYRALGAALVDGVVRCAALPAEPAQADRVRCDSGGWALDLTTYRTPQDLLSARAQAMRPAPDSARSATAAAPGAVFLLEQTLSGASRVYWDVESPRPVSAVATSSQLPLSGLLAAYDARRVSTLVRPEQPGAAFVSPVLWQLAAGIVTSAGGQCTPRAEPFRKISEQVDCTFPGQHPSLTFGLFTGEAAFQEFRTAQLGEEGAVPGTNSTGTWREDGRLSEYKARTAGLQYLYWDRADLRAFGLLNDDVLDRDALRRFWDTHHRGS